MSRNGDSETPSIPVADNAILRAREPSIVSASPAPPPTASGPPQEPGGSTSLKLRIVAGFAAMTLVVALMMGIFTAKILSDSGLSPDLATSMRRELLLWGFGAVIIASLLGAIFARQISEPLRRLTEELRQKDFHDLADCVQVRHEFLELEQLSLTIRTLASSVRSRDFEISASERKFREAFDLVGIGLTQVDTEGRFVMVNRRFCEMLGYSAEELKGKLFIDITHPEDQPSDEAMLHAIVSQGLPAQVNREKRYIRKDGSVLWAQRSGVVVRDATGKPV